MKKSIGVIIGIIVIVAVVCLVAFKSNDNEVKNDRYITSGKVMLTDDFELDIDYLKENSENCLQTYYDKETGYIHWVYSESAMVKE